jgi:hypothetical protein
MMLILESSGIGKAKMRIIRSSSLDQINNQGCAVHLRAFAAAQQYLMSLKARFSMSDPPVNPIASAAHSKYAARTLA